MSDCVFEMNWPELPNGLQKYIILMIENMQKPLYYHGFGIVNLDLETFAKVSVFYITFVLNDEKIEYIWFHFLAI